MRYYKAGIILICAVCLFSCNQKQKNSQQPVDVQEEEIIQDTLPRTSITFILGYDKSGYNQYYTLAGYYYRLNEADKTEIIIDSITALSEVCRYIKEHPPVNNRPYGLINLVCHGNEFIDMGVLVTPHGVRASAESIEKAIRDSAFLPIDTNCIDTNTLIYLHGCAIGNNQPLLNGLSVAFGSQQNGVKVKASKLFEYYAYLSRNKNPQSIQHYFAKAWYAFYHPDSLVGQQYFIRQFTKRYPREQIQWEEGLNRRFQSNPGEIYHFSFFVPVVWDEVYDDEALIPALNTKNRKKEWLMNNKSLLNLIQQTQIPLEYFQFKYYRQKYRQGDQEVYVLRLKAKTGVICLIQPLLSENDSLKSLLVPFHPDENDSLYFGFSYNDRGVKNYSKVRKKR
ncbi:MAG: hypothetical protein LBE13_11960 [Bacteroidales bacterium]|jgi:hypothetical protein|nr:hypothetical protein [Bacteroidales bacterium]